MPRPKSHGPYTPLAANYYLDDAVLEAKEHAELLFVRCLSFLATGDTDGFISDLQMRHAVGIGLRNVNGRIETLTKVGLLLHVDGGYEVRSYLKWNKSAEQIGRHLRRDRERKARKQAGVDPTSDRNPDGIRADSADHVTTRHVTSLHDTKNPLSDADASDAGTLLDDGWRPTQKHIDLADSLHLDKQRTFERFVDHARRTHRRQKNWNTAFTNWLQKDAQFAQQRQGTPSPARTTAAVKNHSVVEHFAALEAGQNELEEHNG